MVSLASSTLLSAVVSGPRASWICEFAVEVELVLFSIALSASGTAQALRRLSTRIAGAKNRQAAWDREAGGGFSADIPGMAMEIRENS
jgi:hypothetical protein